MKTIRGIANLTQNSLSPRFDSPTHSVVTIGNFDGVHLGHAQIIKTAIQKARAKNGHAVAYTFRPHPQIALRSESKIQLISTYDEKLGHIEELGVDWVVEEPFDLSFSKVEPDRFFHEFLIGHLKAEAIVVGYDFAFGRERHGHLESLRTLCESAKIELTIVEPYRVGDGEVVSSSKIRHYLENGSMLAAEKLLGRKFFYRGPVIHGDGRGKNLGFPTANMKLELGLKNKIALPYGVYATQSVFQGQIYASVTNVGVRPTFDASLVSTGGSPVWVETHVLDQASDRSSRLDFYNQILEVRFIERLRAEKKFASINELKLQIAQDVEQARLIGTSLTAT